MIKMTTTMMTTIMRETARIFFVGLKLSSRDFRTYLSLVVFFEGPQSIFHFFFGLAELINEYR